MALWLFSDLFLALRMISQQVMLMTEQADNKENYLKIKEDVKELGVTPQTTYLFVQGHHLFDNVVIPILSKVCNRLRMERQDEIARQARHHTQKQNEMSCYEHSVQDIKVLMRKNMGYILSPYFRQIQRDVESYLNSQSPSRSTMGTTISSCVESQNVSSRNA